MKFRCLQSQQELVTFELLNKYNLSKKFSLFLTKPNFCERYKKNLNLVLIELDLLKPNTKTQNIFCCENENLTTFLYTLTGGTRKQEEKKKVFSFKVYTKVE